MQFDKGVVHLVTAVVVASVVLPIGAPPASAAPLRTVTKPLHLRNGLTLYLPSSWKVYSKDDHIRVVTGACIPKPRAIEDPKDALWCDGFMVLGPKFIKHGDEGFKPYTGKQPYNPSSGMLPCPRNDKWGQSFHGAKVMGLRPVGPGHKALYREWKARCFSLDGGAVKSRYVQREWFLPQEEVLIVDPWNTPGLAGVLKRATWE